MSDQCVCEKDKEPTPEMVKCFEKNFSASMDTCASFYNDTGCKNYTPSECHNIGFRPLLYIAYGFITFYTVVAVFLTIFVMNKLKIQRPFIGVACIVIMVLAFLLAKDLTRRSS